MIAIEHVHKWYGSYHALRDVSLQVKKGERVSLPGFGTFERRNRSARTARNPRTGEEIKVAATKVPAFKPGATLKAAVSGKDGKD